MRTGGLFSGLAFAFVFAGCSSSSSSSTCGTDTSVHCDADSTGYSCSGAVMPSGSNASLVCSEGTQLSDGKWAYCCISFDSTGCSVNADVAGCGYPAYGFQCLGTASPTKVDTSLTCTGPVPSPTTTGVPGMYNLYCCQ